MRSSRRPARSLGQAERAERRHGPERVRIRVERLRTLISVGTRMRSFSFAGVDVS